MSTLASGAANTIPDGSSVASNLFELAIADLCKWLCDVTEPKFPVSPSNLSFVLKTTDLLFDIYCVGHDGLKGKMLVPSSFEKVIQLFFHWCTEDLHIITFDPEPLSMIQEVHDVASNIGEIVLTLLEVSKRMHFAMHVDPPRIVRVEIAADDSSNITDAVKSRLDMRRRPSTKPSDPEYVSHDVVMSNIEKSMIPFIRRIGPFLYTISNLELPVYLRVIDGVPLARYDGSWYDMADFMNAQKETISKVTSPLALLVALNTSNTSLAPHKSDSHMEVPGHHKPVFINKKLARPSQIISRAKTHHVYVAGTDWFAARSESFLNAKTVVPMRIITQSELYEGAWMLKVNSKGKLVRCFMKVVGTSRETLALLSLKTETRGIWDTARFSQTRLLLSNVIEIRKGQRTVMFDKCREIWGSDQLAFSVMYRNDHHVAKLLSVDLVCDTEEQRHEWMTGLREVAIIANKEAYTEKRDPVRRKWRELSPSGGKLDDKKIAKLFKQLNVRVTKRGLRRLMAHYRIQPDHMWDYSEFDILLLDIETNTRTDVKEILRSNTTSGRYFTVEEFHIFLRNVQKEDVTFDRALEVIRRFKPSDRTPTLQNLKANKKTEDRLFFSALLSSARMLTPKPVEQEMHHRVPMSLNIIGFLRFLNSEYCRIFDPVNETIVMALDRPLTEYFVASSHNTYLLGAQYLDDSSVDAYISALRRGARCLELDLHDNTERDVQVPVIVTHGGAATSLVNFRSVCDTIHEFGFEVTDTPLILSIENHCKVENHAFIATTFREVFGSRLLIAPSFEEMKMMDHYSSPEELRGKVIIKGKGFSDLGKSARHREPLFQRLLRPSARDFALNDAFWAQNENDTADESVKPTSKVAPELDEVQYLKQFRVKADSKDLERAISQVRPYVMSSFNADAIDNFASNPRRFAEYNLRALNRVYPNPVRPEAWRSGNYSPLKAWKYGCQFAALNYQTRDFPMRVNEAFFQQNGSCGYVLKPSYMRDPDHPFDFNQANVDNRIEPWSLKVTVISAQHLQLPNSQNATIDPFCAVQVAGIPSDQAQFVSAIVHENGPNPVWNFQVEFLINCPDLAVLHFEVVDSDQSENNILGYYAISVMTLREGYRHFHLRRPADGKEINMYCTLFCHIEKKIIRKI